MLIGDIIRRTARYFPGKTGVVSGDSRFTWGEVNARVNRLANALTGLGLKKGERVGMLSRNCHQYLEFFLAVAKAGLVAVPLNTEFKGAELRHVINDAGAGAIIVQGGLAETLTAAAPAQPGMIRIGFGAGHGCPLDLDVLMAQSAVSEPDVTLSDDDLWLLAYTSGTTGKPKGAMMTQRNGVAGAINDIWTLMVDAADTYLVSGPFYLNSSGGVRMATVMAGATLVIMTYEAGAVLKTIQEERVTRLHGGPAMLNRLVNHPDVHKYDVSSIRGIAVTGAPLRLPLWKSLEEVFGRIVYPIYGLTENCGDATVLRRKDVLLEETDRRADCVGKPTLLVDVRVVDENDAPVRQDGGEIGEVVVRGDPVTGGYWNDPEKTAAVVRGGWFHTGDLAVVDSEGYLYIVDRKSDTIKSGGRQIYPRELEEVILTHPSVLRCAVFRVPDDRWGETPKAVVELKDGATATEAEIIELCRKNLASYKKPSSVEFVTSMPMTPSGKIVKKSLMAPYWKGGAAA